MTDINLDVWGRSDDKEDGVRAIGDWVMLEGELILADDDRVQGLNLPVIEPDILLIFIQQILRGETAGISEELVNSYQKIGPKKKK